MSADRELVEAAARAAGIEVGPDDFTDEIGRKWSQGLGLWVRLLPGTKSGHWWDPLHRDADALRLAVKVRIDLIFGETQVGAIGEIGSEEFIEPYGNDANAAVRRAITRAAAASLSKGQP